MKDQVKLKIKQPYACKSASGAKGCKTGVMRPLLHRFRICMWTSFKNTLCILPILYQIPGLQTNIYFSVPAELREIRESDEHRFCFYPFRKKKK